MNKILLIITTYNQSEYTKLCFDSLKNLEDGIDVLVIDDCSADNTIKLCKEYGHEVITKKEGMGLTDSWNNDILIPKGAITELKKTFQQWPFSLITPMSTANGVGHNIEQSIENYYQGMSPSCNDPNYYQEIQDRILDTKNQIKNSNNLYQLDSNRMKMFNGFFFMMNRNIIKYQYSDKELFEPKFIMTKNEDEFNWSKLIPNNDFAGICKTSFIFHYKGVSTFKIFDNYGKMSNNISEWKKQRELKDG